MEVMDESAAIVRRQVQSVEFGFYTDEDVRIRSVVEVTSSEAFDPMSNNPLPGGLCDPRMGPGEHNDYPCPTCALRKFNCPGHFGHVELAVPVHHPLLIKEILSILRAKCSVCHKLRGPPRQMALCRAKFNLLWQGRIDKIHSLDDEMQVALAKRKQDGTDKLSTADAARILNEVLRQYQPENTLNLDSIAQNQQPMAFCSSNSRSNRKLNSYERTLRKIFIKECLASCQNAKRCPHCGAHSPKIRQDSGNKFFRGILSQRSRRANELGGLTLQSALEQSTNENSGYQSDDSAARRRLSNASDPDDDPPVPNDNMETNNDDDDDNDASSTVDDDYDDDDGGNKNNDAPKDQYMHTKEVQAQLKLTWKTDPYLLNCLFGPGESLSVNGYQIFFLQAIPVPPNRFRPSMEVGGRSVEHSQNTYLSNIISLNEKVRNLFSTGNEPKAYTEWINLQTTVNCYMDSSKDPSSTPAHLVAPGIRQILERKEGLFRMNMMGKRVDFACRSVISPDPYVGSNEIGLPLYFATVLTYPTPVTPFNIKEMRTLVERGPANYPGARWVETHVGRKQRIDLAKMNPQARAAVAAMLLTNLKKSGRPAVIGRQLKDGDYVLMNRQPTLHKPGIMAHRVRVLHSPTQKTIRMHYANCDTYNADFDGDEMNCHFPQNDIGRAEAIYIARNDLQYIVPTDGSPLRGLIQDHVIGGVKLTTKDTFLEKWEYQQLLFACLSSLPGIEVIRSDAAIELVPPAIMKPRELWTGKQVVTTLLLHLRKGSDRDYARTSNLPGISMENKAKTPGTAFGVEQGEHLVLILDGELLRGVLDKNSFGATSFSLIHCVHEAYGPEKAGILINAFSRLFTAYIQYFAGHSCRTEDLILTKKADEVRKKLIKRAYNLGTRAAKAWADSEGGKVAIAPFADKPESAEPLDPVEIAATSAKLGELLSGTEGAHNFAALDGYMQGQLNPLASDIVKKSLPDGLVVPFPFNSFGIMTTTGAKGSIVNQSQVVCALGQQALEGRRVPRLSSGKTLPSFAPYDPNPRADGFVMDRFLTGIRPQEYYFHCMAGREGLVDTAVKTSRSGYLQRCLVKHLEELKICYDFTVRNAEGGVVQFLYGEDGIDPTKAPFLNGSKECLVFLARNHESVSRHNPSLPSSTIDLSAEAALRHDAVARRLDNLLSPGARVRARKLREGNVWRRGALCLGWFDAIITKVRKGGEAVDLRYLKDGTLAKRVPIEVDFGSHPNLENVATSVATLVEPVAFDPIISSNESGHRLGSSGACLSERVARLAYDQIKNNGELKTVMKRANLSSSRLGEIISAKYSTSLCAPGEAVGSIAAQSIGEPSTQMTLNTFHLAGAGANVTLGIPRLREIIMTASKQPKTPTMSVPLHSFVDQKAALRLTRDFTKLTLIDLISGDRGVAVTEKLEKSHGGVWDRVYYVRIKLYPEERIREAFGLSINHISKIVGSNFTALLSQLMKKELKRAAADGGVRLGEVESGLSQNQTPDGDDDDAGEHEGNESGRGARDELDDDQDSADDDDTAGDEDGADADKERARKEGVSYEEASGEENESVDGNNADDYSRADQEEIGKESTGYKGDSVRVLKDSNTIVLQPLKVDPAARPLLMVGLAEQAAKKTVIHQRKNIHQAFINDEDDGRGRCLQTSGVDFEEIWNLEVVDHDRLLSNDVWALRCGYGVEAARESIVQQIRGVFGVYGIEVDPRHLTLIADYMTYEGGFKPMNRIGMLESSSPFLQMSFETTSNFLKLAAMAHDVDSMSSPSSNLVLGRPIRHGTGMFEVLARS